MKFAEIIRNTGLNPEEFKNCSDIEINLYDGKDHLYSEDTVQFVEPLFKYNEKSLLKFKKVITALDDTIELINIKVDIATVILFYNTPKAVVLSRTPLIDPIDYLD